MHSECQDMGGPWAGWIYSITAELKRRVHREVLMKWFYHGVVSNPGMSAHLGLEKEDASDRNI